jgi:hypothetical protein
MSIQWILSCLGAMALAAPATAAPIPYLIDFQLTSGSALPSGRFTYDAGTTTFSDFVVEWDSIHFDFTALANGGPEFVAAAPGVCGLPAGPAGSFALLSGQDTCSDRQEFSGARLFGGGDFVFRTSQSLVGLVRLQVAGVAAPSGNNDSFGTFRITPVPEPAAGVLFGLGLAALGVATRRIRPRQG